jgi:hypothetical protein
MRGCMAEALAMRPDAPHISAGAVNAGALV